MNSKGIMRHTSAVLAAALITICSWAGIATAQVPPPPGRDAYGADIIGVLSASNGDNDYYITYSDPNVEGVMGFVEGDTDGVLQTVLVGNFLGAGLPQGERVEDIAALNSDGAGNITARIQSGGSYASQTPWTGIGAAGIKLHSKFVAADFNADGYTDIAAIYADTPATANTVRAKISFGPDGMTKTTWTLGTGVRKDFLAGQFTSGNAADIAEIFIDSDATNYYLKANIFAGESSGALAQTRTIRSWAKSTPMLPGQMLVGDFNADGSEDIATVDLANSASDGIFNLIVSQSPAGSVVTRTINTTLGARKFTQFLADDFNYDGVTDVAALHIVSQRVHARIALMPPTGSPSNFRSWFLSHADGILHSKFVTGDVNRMNSPGTVTATDGTFTDKVRVTWSVVPMGAVSFTLYRSTTSTPCSGTAIPVAGAVNSFDDTGATPGVNYFYSVRAVGSSGGHGFCSTVDGGSRGMPAIANLLAGDGSSGANVPVNWGAIVGAVNYDLYRSTTVTACAGGTLLQGAITGTSFADTSATPGVVYYYSAIARGANGAVSACSNVDSGFRLAAATGVTASDGTSTAHVAVSWTAPLGATTYDIYRNGTCSGSPLAAAVPAASYNDATAVPGVTYTYSVVAKSGSGGVAPCSNSDQGYRGMSAPTGLTASDGSSTAHVAVSWTATAGAVSYDLYRSETEGASCQGTPIAPGLGSITYNDASATPGVTYYYSAIARGANNSVGGCSNVDAGFRALPAPTGIAASDGTSTERVDVIWTASAGATSYNVFRSDTAMGAGTQIGSSATPAFADTTAEPCVNYYYYVRAVRGSRVSADSTRDVGFRASTASCEQIPSTPLNLQASDGTSSDYVRVTWDAALRAIDYTLYRSQFEGAMGSVVADRITGTSFDDISAVPGVFYFYTVKARNDLGMSDPSNTDRGYRAAIDGCDADCDGDGVCDAQEIIDGTEVCDPGSFQLHLKSPAFTKYNTFLHQQQYLELIANGTATVEATITVYRIDGTLKATTSRSIAPRTQVDVDINQLVNEDQTYGLVRIDFNDTVPGATLTGRMATYRNNLVGGGYSFAFARELRNPMRGVSFSIGNSFDQTGGGNLVPNWAEIINVEDTTIQVMYKLYSQSGTLLKQETIAIDPREEFDIDAGHTYGEGVYLAEFQPVNGAHRYLASVARYSSNSKGGGEAETYNYAFAMDAKAGNGSAQFAATTKKVSAAYTQTNWVEILNVREVPAIVTAKFRGQNGEMLSQSSFQLEPRNQYHVQADALLSAGQIGSVELYSDVPGALIVQSAVYFNDIGSNTLQTAYVTPARIPGQDVQAGTFNRFLQMNNEMTLIGTSDIATDVTIETRQGDQLLSSVVQPLGAQTATALDLGASIFNTQPDSYGSIVFRSAEPRRFVAQILRVRPEASGKIDFVMPTAVQ